MIVGRAALVNVTEGGENGGKLVLLKMDRKRYNKKLHHLQSPLKAGL
jgi:hypothetical protein